MTVIANYAAERAAFESLLRDDCDERILVVKGASGSGKTTLIKHCRSIIPRGFITVPIQLRATTVGVTEIFSRAGEHLGWDRLRNFVNRIESLQGAHKVEIDRAKSIGFNNQIIVAMQSESTVDRDDRRGTLTEALFDDLRTLDRPILFMLDTFEQAPVEVQQWISGPFLARVARVRQLRVLIAGQVVPENNNIEWGECCCIHELMGVPDARAWLPVLQGMGRIIPRVDKTDNPLTWLSGVCYAFKGDPSKIMQAIEGLPLQEPR